MEKFKKFLYKVFFINGISTVLLCIISAILLTIVFTKKLENSPLAIIAYVLSAYTLTAAVCRFPSFIKFCKNFLHSNKHTKRYLSEDELRARISIYSSLSLHIFYSVFKLASGVYYGSFWLCSEAVYYIILSTAQYTLAVGEKKHRQTAKEWKTYGVCGGIMLILNLAIGSIITITVLTDNGYVYSGILIYATAAYTFYRLIIAFLNIKKYRKINRPVLSASKFLNLSAALMSLFALQTAMLTQFGDEKVNTIALNACTGFFVSFSTIYIAISMIVRAKKEINKTKT